jgi:hypothetical protein
LHKLPKVVNTLFRKGGCLERTFTLYFNKREKNEGMGHGDKLQVRPTKLRTLPIVFRTYENDLQQKAYP